MEKAIELLGLFDKTFEGDSNFRGIYQEVADVMFPRESAITTKRSKGAVIGREIVDPTGINASIDATAGLSINLFPPGDKYYNVVMADPELNKKDIVKRKCGQITDISHQKRANSNFILQSNETLRSLITLGTGNIFSEWMPSIGLNYRDYDVGMYTFLENDRGLVDTMMIEFPYSAKQAFQRWGKNAGETVLVKYNDSKTSNDEFKFVWITRPRNLEKQTGNDMMSMPFESFFVSRTDSVIVEEGGFPEFPFQVSRWAKSSCEKWGRGVGTVAIGIVNTLQTERQALTDCGNLHNNPPKEVLESFDGEVRIKSGDLNFVQEMGSIAAIQQQALGNFAITKDVLEMDRQEVRKMFYNDAFNQLEQLKGDRRNELEIRSRLAEGLRKLVMPVGRIQSEWLTGMIKRDIGLLYRNGELGEIPKEMQGKELKIEYIGRMALELQAAQSMGWVRWVQEGADIEQVAPGTLDLVNIDSGYKRRGITLGVNVDDIATEEQVKEKREARALKEQKAMELEMLKLAPSGYASATKAPEQGSPAEGVV